MLATIQAAATVIWHRHFFSDAVMWHLEFQTSCLHGSDDVLEVPYGSVCYLIFVPSIVHCNNITVSSVNCFIIAMLPLVSNLSPMRVKTTGEDFENSNALWSISRFLKWKRESKLAICKGYLPYHCFILAVLDIVPVTFYRCTRVHSLSAWWCESSESILFLVV